MLLIFSALRSLIPKVDQTTIDNNAFRLHYKVTVVILVAAAILVTSRENFGDPISCTHTSLVPDTVLNPFCWVQATYSLANTFDKSKQQHVVAPGLGSHGAYGGEKIYHKYYQWVSFVLFMQALLFYVPRYIWKMWEAGKMKMLRMELNAPVLPDAVKDDMLGLLRNYFLMNLNSHKSYVTKFLISEVLCLVNVLGQIFLMDKFLGGEFSSYGLRVLEFINTNEEDRFDPMVRIFPRVTMCDFKKFGPTGNMENIDVMCVLPLNIVNEKIYTFLWFWFMMLASITAMNIIYRVLTIVLPWVRIHLLRARAPMVPLSDLEVVLERCQFGDWFVLYQLSKNLDHLNFKALIQDLAGEAEVLKGMPGMGIGGGKEIGISRV